MYIHGTQILTTLAIASFHPGPGLGTRLWPHVPCHIGMYATQGILKFDVIRVCNVYSNYHVNGLPPATPLH